MRHALPVLLALCCVLSMGATAMPLAPPSPDATSDAAPAGQPSQAGDTSVTHRLLARSPQFWAACVDSPYVVCVANTTNYLAPPRDQVVVTTHDGTALDLSAALATEAAALDGRFRDETLGAAFSAAETDAARRAVIERYTRQVEERTAALREAEREALRAYNRDTMTTRAYLRTLAELDATGDRLQRTVDRLDNYRLRVPGSNVTLRRLEAIRADLVALDGPIRDRIQRVHAGAAPPMRVFVETSTDGVVLSAIVEENGQRTFLREAYLGDVRRQSTGENRYQHNIGGAFTRAEELYPWVFSHGEIDRVNGDAEVYVVGADHQHGQLTTYLDGQSGTVFAEHQEKDVSALPTTTERTANESAGLALVLERTHAGGPLNVTVLDPSTGERLDASVSVNNETVGRTGADGTLWTVMPRSTPVTVTAERGGETVTTTVFAREAEAVGVEEA